MIIDRSKVGNVCIRVKLPAFEKVIRNFQLTVKKSKALLSDQAAAISEFRVELQSRDVA
jgi:hypothetical protein